MTDTERPRPYVGVSGVTSPAMEKELETMAADAGLFAKGRLLALGVKATHKTQFLDTENKYGAEWYPVGDDFSRALHPTHRSMNTMSVAQTYLDVEHVDDAEYRRAFMAKITKRGRGWLQAVQFDMLPWDISNDSLDFLREVRDFYNLDLMVQAHRRSMETLGPDGVIRRLGHYAGVIDYLLFDASHGTGVRMDADALRPFVAAAHESDGLRYTGIAVAGGLDSEAVREDLPALVTEFPELSWDAEGKLHPVNADGKRPLDMNVTRDYLHASASIIA